MCYSLGVLNGRSLHSPPVAFEEIEKRVQAPLPFTQRDHNKLPSFARSEPLTHDSSLPGDAADLMARPLSSNPKAPIRSKPLPPIIRGHQGRQRRNAHLQASNRADQLLENQRRITRFIKNIK